MSLVDPETGERIWSLDIARLVGTDGDMGAVAIMKDGRQLPLFVSLERCNTLFKTKPETRQNWTASMTLQKRKSMP